MTAARLTLDTTSPEISTNGSDLSSSRVCTSRSASPAVAEDEEIDLDAVEEHAALMRQASGASEKSEGGGVLEEDDEEEVEHKEQQSLLARMQRLMTSVELD